MLLAGGGALLVAGLLFALLGRKRSEPAATAPPPAERAPRPGDTWTNNKDGMASVWLPPGRFTMGCTPGDARCDPAQLPPRQITFDRGFWMARTEVTVGAYKKFAGETATRLPEAPAFNAGWSKDDHPMVNVTWDDARAYCAWSGGRMPSEAEWEYAARGGHPDWFQPWGNEPAACAPGAPNGARFDDGAACRKAGTERVAAYGPNGFGLHDIAGNAWEWCADEWNSNYSDAPSDGRAFEEGSTSSRRVLRGGSWINGADYLRVSIRSRWYQNRGRDFIGFRCVRDGEAR
jgi:formylglycine-generating enzyme required for sulfatase activity